jgi:hypothetical protein
VLTPTLSLLGLGRRQRSRAEIDSLTLCRRARPAPRRSDNSVRTAQPHAHKRILFGPWVFHVNSNSMGSEMGGDRKARGMSLALTPTYAGLRGGTAQRPYLNGQRC